MSIKNTLIVHKYEIQKKDAKVLDLSEVTSKSELHEKVKNFFGFPDYYGGNLDALYDCLTDISEETNVTIILPERWPKENDEYIRGVIKVFDDAASDNRNLMILFAYPE